MKETTEVISEYFLKRINLTPSVRQRNVLGGFAHTIRAEAIPSLALENIFAQEGALYSNLTGIIYDIGIAPLNAVVSFYGDGTVLWLDDHTTNVDYISFIEREHLLDWLPNQVHKLAELMAETKFSFLGRPRVIKNIHDIPITIERRVNTWPQPTIKKVTIQPNRGASVLSRSGLSTDSHTRPTKLLCITIFCMD